MKTLTKLVQSKYNKHLKEVLTVLSPAEQQSGDIAASTGWALRGDGAPEE